jgi:isopenicillin-N epimerase
MLEEDSVYLNHGTVGATPRRVIEAQRRIVDEMERHPSRFMLRELAELAGITATGPSRLRVAAEAVASFVGARASDLVFVDNATTGVNAVLRSFDLREGDEVLLTDHNYGAIAHAARYVARGCGAALRTVTLPYPAYEPGKLLQAVEAAITPRTRIAVLDHITSESALVLPLAELAEICHRHGVAVLADGAHAPGAIALDVAALGVDWYAANLHKWAWAPRSSGFLWADPAQQPGLHPVVISWGLDEGYTREFDWVGTRDPTPYLAAPAGIELMRELDLEAVQRWNHGLAWESARLLTARWNTCFEPAEQTVGTMVTVPLPRSCGSTRAEAAALRDALLFDEGIEVQLHAWGGQLWTRVSAQVYNELADVALLADAVARRA